MIDPIFEIIGLSAAFLTTSAFIPQVYKIYKEKNADGISLTMYVILFIGVLLWLIYGILIGSLSIIIANRDGNNYLETWVPYCLLVLERDRLREPLEGDRRRGFGFRRRLRGLEDEVAVVVRRVEAARRRRQRVVLVR